VTVWYSFFLLACAGDDGPSCADAACWDACAAAGYASGVCSDRGCQCIEPYEESDADTDTDTDSDTDSDFGFTDRAEVTLPSTPTGAVVTGSGDILVGDGAGVHTLDPDALAVTASRDLSPTAGAPTAVSADGTQVLIVDFNAVWSFDIADWSGREHFAEPAAAFFDALYVGDDVYAAAFNDRGVYCAGSGCISAFYTVDLGGTAEFAPTDLAAIPGETRLLVADPYNGVVRRLDTATGDLGDGFLAGNTPRKLAVTADGAWALAIGDEDPRVYRVSLDDADPVATPFELTGDLFPAHVATSPVDARVALVVANPGWAARESQAVLFDVVSGEVLARATFASAPVWGGFTVGGERAVVLDLAGSAWILGLP
jgi:hypothetical protein